MMTNLYFNNSFPGNQMQGSFLSMRPANEGRHYIVTSSGIGSVHTQNDPWDDIVYTPCETFGINYLIWIGMSKENVSLNLN